MSEKITYKQYNSYTTRCVNKTLKNFGQSLSEATIKNVTQCVQEIWCDTKELIVTDDWHDRIKFQAIPRDSRSVENCKMMGIRGIDFINMITKESNEWWQKHSVLKS